MRWTRGGRQLVGAVALLAALGTIAGCTSGSEASAPPEDATTTTPDRPGATSTSSSPDAPIPVLPEEVDPSTAAGALALLEGLTVRTADPDQPYRRAEFGDDWDYDPKTRCNTRERVLAEESVVPATTDDRCRPTGRWRSPYDGRETTDIADLQIDHVVALADAWRSGAWAWSADRRRAFANDLSRPDTLVAVTGSTNESKGDSTPDEWMPPDRADWCSYAASWVRIKAAWDLSVRTPEAARLRQVLERCRPLTR